MLRRFTLLPLAIFLACVSVFAMTARPVKAAGSASVAFACDQLVVTGTTDQFAIRASVLVPGTGIPGTARATGTFVIPGAGLRPFSVSVPISPTLTNPFAVFDPNSVRQWIRVEGLDAGLGIVD